MRAVQRYFACCDAPCTQVPIGSKDVTAVPVDSMGCSSRKPLKHMISIPYHLQFGPCAINVGHANLHETMQPTGGPARGTGGS